MFYNKKSLLALFVVGLAGANANTFTDLPQCVLGCVSTYITKCGPDMGCICKTIITTIHTIEECVIRDCGTQVDLTTLTEEFNKVCATFVSEVPSSTEEASVITTTPAETSNSVIVTTTTTEPLQMPTFTEASVTPSANATGPDITSSHGTGSTKIPTHSGNVTKTTATSPPIITGAASEKLIGGAFAAVVAAAAVVFAL